MNTEHVGLAQVAIDFVKQEEVEDSNFSIFTYTRATM